MKRHFSNRGEAISEVTAARVLVSRKIAVTASFITKADRTKPPFWSSQQVGIRNRPGKQPKRNDDNRMLL